MFWKLFVATLFITGVFADFTLSEEKKQDLKNQLKSQCEKANAPANATDDLVKAAESFINCLKGIVNVDQLKDEIEKAKPHGALDEVFKKYCAKTPQIKACIHTVIDAGEPCLDASSKAHLSSAKNGTDQLIDFVCYKDGDRIALFIAEKGPECFAAKAEAIRTCATNMQKNTPAEEVKDMTIEARCAKYDELTECIVATLEQCDTPTPGNMAESLLKYIRKSFPCTPKN